MPKFSAASIERLESCVEPIQLVFQSVIETIDCTILCGHRGELAQNEAYRTGHSRLRWPEGPHNPKPSNAVDAAPYPIDWKDRERFTLFAGFVLGTADALGVKLIWGGDWNRDWRVADNRFDDLVHFTFAGARPAGG